MRELFDADGPDILLDIRGAEPEDSSFVGVVAGFGAGARLRSKTLTVRAAGRAADLLVGAGLHRLVTLHVSGEVAAET